MGSSPSKKKEKLKAKPNVQIPNHKLSQIQNVQNPLNSIPCEFCNSTFSLNEYNNHLIVVHQIDPYDEYQNNQEIFEQEPREYVPIKPKIEPVMIGASSVPCEICSAPIPFGDFEFHLTTQHPDKLNLYPQIQSKIHNIPVLVNNPYNPPANNQIQLSNIQEAQEEADLEFSFDNDEELKKGCDAFSTEKKEQQAVINN